MRRTLIWALGTGALLSLAAPGMSGSVTTKIDGIEIGGEVRTRYEYRSPENYSNAVVQGEYESDDFGMLRARLHADLNVSNDVKGFFQIQHTTINGATAVGTDDSDLTLHQGYFTGMNLWGMPLDLTAGRKELHYGDGRLIGRNEWSNNARHWDGAWLRYRPDDSSWLDIGYSELANGDSQDVAGTVGSPVNLQPARAAGTSSDPDEDSDMYYAWYQMMPSDDMEVNLYHILQHNGAHGASVGLTETRNGQGLDLSFNSGDINRHTTGVLAKYDSKDMYFSGEYDLQYGHVAKDRISSVGYALVAGMRMDGSSLEVEYAYASGDTDPQDGVDGSFQAPFREIHKYHGAADLVAWRNVVDYKIQYNMDLAEDMKLTVAAHKFERAEEDDSWYTGAGGVLRTGKGFADNVYRLGTAAGEPTKNGFSGSRDIGMEFDGMIHWQHSQFMSFDIGYSYFVQGRFARDTMQTGNMEFAYVQGQLKF